MSDDYFEAVSKSKNPVYHHKDPKEGPVQGVSHLEQITDHIEKNIGPIEMVYHEMVSDLVHIDVHHVKATKDFPFHTLVTSGMSDVSMTVPDEDVCPYLELCLHLPDDWQIDMESFKDEKWYWPVRMLKFAARFPHQYNTYLSYGHTVSNGTPPEPFHQSLGFNGLIVLPSVILGDDFIALTINEDKDIQFLSIVPLYEEEMNLKLRKGCDALLDKFDKNDYFGVIDPQRKNFAKKRFGIF